jgi:uncharacterized protein YecE (DUF72 family)
MAENPPSTGGHSYMGTSGWVYPHWKGIFYPENLPQSQWFQHYARYFGTVEINSTFYRLPAETTFDRWRERAPPGFLYAVKASRYISHIKRLRECEEPLALFLGRARHLGATLGPILYQLPPRWRPNLPRLSAFVKLLPPDLAHVMEFRDPRWFDPQVLEVLRGCGVSFCIYHMPGIECPPEVTAAPIYIRMHGARALYGGSYDRETLRRWTERIRGWCQTGYNVYVYFNNDAFGHAVRNALTLKEMLG